MRRCGDDLAGLEASSPTAAGSQPALSAGTKPPSRRDAHACVCIDAVVQERLFEEVNGADGLFWSLGSQSRHFHVDVERSRVCYIDAPRETQCLDNLLRAARKGKTCWQDAPKEAASFKLSHLPAKALSCDDYPQVERASPSDIPADRGKV